MKLQTKAPGTPNAIVIALVFVILIFVGDRTLAWVCAELVGMSQDRYVNLYHGRSTAEILVIGNSKADNHFPPKMMASKFGRPVENLGLGGISMVLAETLIRDYIDRNKKPGLIILEPTALLVPPETIGDMRLFAPDSERISNLIRTHMPEFYYAKEFFHSFNYNNEMFFRVLYRIIQPPQDRLHYSTLNRAQMDMLLRRGDYSISSHHDNLESFERIMQFANEHEIPLTVILTPTLPQQADKIVNFTDWKLQIEKLIGDRAPFHDFSLVIEDPQLFSDGQHLNTQGVSVFLEKLEVVKEIDALTAGGKTHKLTTEVRVTSKD